MGYEHANIKYKVKIENNTAHALSEIRVKPFIPQDLFISDAEEKTISLIKPGETKTVTFTMRPKGECGNVEISGKATYYDTGLNKHDEVELKARQTAVICPVLKLVQLDPDDWQATISSMLKVEEATNDVPIEAKSLFDIVCDVIKDLNMFLLPTKITESANLYRGSAHFYCEGIKKLKYGAAVEIVGGATKSKMILRAYAENEESLVGFYHCMLDEIQKRTNVKDYIDQDGQTVIQHIHGDMIGSQVSLKDSVVSGSNLGGGVSGGAAGTVSGVSGGGTVNIQDSVVTGSQIGTGGEEIPCPSCGGKIASNYSQCPWCGNEV